jgi:hypothetical protein
MLPPPSAIPGDDYSVHSQPESPRYCLGLPLEAMPVIIVSTLYLYLCTTWRKLARPLEQESQCGRSFVISHLRASVNI